MDPYVSPKIVFPHIMKTGGTSLIAWLQRHYHRHEILYNASIWPQLYKLEMKKAISARFVRGHFGTGILNLFGSHNGFTPIALVRDPLERVISHYWHHCRAPDVKHAFVRENNLSFEEFLEFDAARRFVCNYQTANYGVLIDPKSEHPGPVDFTNYSINKSNLERAKSFIDMCPVVGLTEDLPDFVRRISDYFGLFPDPDLIRARSYRVPSSISKSAVARVRELNAFDYELYEYVRARIQLENHQRSDHVITTVMKLNEQVQPVNKINPILPEKDGSYRWSAGQPFWGCGWDNPVINDKCSHIWSLKNEASVVINLAYNTRGTIIFSLFRFCAQFQSKMLRIYINGRPVRHEELKHDEDGGVTYALNVPPSDTSQIELTFFIEKLATFASVDSNATDHTPRGLALADVTYLPEVDFPVAKLRNRVTAIWERILG